MTRWKSLGVVRWPSVNKADKNEFHISSIESWIRFNRNKSCDTFNDIQLMKWTEIEWRKVELKK